MINVEYIGKKARKSEKTPYAEFTGFMFGGPAVYKVLKKYANDDSKQFARWLIEATTPATHGFGEMGDTYVTDVINYFELAQVEGRPPTQEELDQIQDLRKATAGQVSPF